MLKGKFMSNKKLIGAVISVLFSINTVYAVNDNVVPGNMGLNPAVNSGLVQSAPKEEKLNVLNAGKKKESSAFETEMDSLNQQLLKLQIQQKIKQAELALKKADQDIKELDNPVKKDSLVPPSLSNLPNGLNISPLSIPTLDKSGMTVSKPNVTNTSSTTVVKSYKKKAKKDAAKVEEKPLPKEIAYSELPLVKGYGGFAHSMQATIVYSNGSENQVQVGDSIMPNVTISNINEKGVFVKNVNSEMKLAMWTKIANTKKEETKLPTEIPMQAPATGPIIYPGITPSISGELRPLMPGNGEVIIPKTVGTFNK